MRLALQEAEKALEHGDVPVGAVIVHNNAVIAKTHNQVELLKDPTAHAEILAITQAADALDNKRLIDCIMYATLEPCPMCTGAIVLARIKGLFFAAADPKLGACGSQMDLITKPGLNHYVNFSCGLEGDASEALLKHFFEKVRKTK